ncbi:MAG: hypothetical protein Q8L48_11135 [Archangium sp.]|nr:hypothetical protein [Archangium sp.]
MIRLCSVVALLLAGCAIELDDVSGRACDETHACRAPRTCISGRCLDLTPFDGGGTDSGLPNPDPDAGVDAGLPRWQQRLHGFTNTTVDPGCTVDIDPARGNRVLATILGPLDSQDTATAELVDLNRLPRTLEGRLRGRITLVAPLSVRGFVPVAYVGTQSGQAFARIGFDGAGRLVVESDAQTVGGPALVERFTVDGGFTAGDWVVEVAWRVGSARQVRLNDVLQADTAVTGGATLPPAELSLGIARYDGDAGTAFTVTLSSWQLADDLLVPLGDQP